MQIFRHIFYEIQKKSDLFCKKGRLLGLEKDKKVEFLGRKSWCIQIVLFVRSLGDGPMMVPF